MAVSKRTRYEVLRRDNYTCRYCRSDSNPLTIDHVTPVALGGSDDPSNLVAACRECNAGKGSSAPDQALVADVDQDALRWAAAMNLAAERAAKDLADRTVFINDFVERWAAVMPHWAELSVETDSTVWRFYTRGLPAHEIYDAINIAAAADGVPQRARWRYFCGICWNKLRAIEDVARAAIENGEVV